MVPDFWTKHPQHDVLYAVGSLDGVDCVAAYQVVGPTGKRSLKLMEDTPIGNGGSCHVSVHPDGKLLLTAQYGTGSVGVFRLNSDGSIEQQTEMINIRAEAAWSRSANIAARPLDRLLAGRSIRICAGLGTRSSGDLSRRCGRRDESRRTDISMRWLAVVRVT